MFKIEQIIIHCSASSFGNLKIIDEWHKNKGWSGCGYHFIILNGYPRHLSNFIKTDNGRIELGRASNIPGAHCIGQNENSLGVCLIGDKTFTERQLLVSLPRLLFNLMEKYSLPLDKVYGHRKFNEDKTCPNIDMDIYRDFLRSFIYHQQILEPYLKNDQDSGL